MDLLQSSLYRLYVRQDKATWGRIVFTALAGGVLQGAMVVVLNDAGTALVEGRLDGRVPLLFLVLLGGYSLASQYASSRTVILAERATFATYVRVAAKLRKMSLIAFERLGKQRIYATLHTNTDLIAETSKSLASVGAAVVMVGVCALYIAFISLPALGIVTLFYLFGYFVYVTGFKRVRTLLNESGAAEKRFRGRFDHFVEGFKELKVNRKLGQVLHAIHIVPDADKAERLRGESEKALSANIVFVQAYYYFMVGSTLFLLPRVTALPIGEVINVTVVMLFSYGSTSRIVMSIPLLLKTERAVEALRTLEDELDAGREDSSVDATSNAVLPFPGKLSLEGITFSYEAEDSTERFVLGPVSLEVSPGEILFLVGGNGSGKTTLLKLLSGLYAPQSGQIRLGETSIDASNRAAYRDHFFVLFPDYHLFHRFYAEPDLDEARLEASLELMGLSDRVSWEDGAFGDFNLSAGQRKRLAMVVAQLDRSQILVLDEVAADLDPSFRRFFYESFLPALRDSGKTIIAVSHDEQYFHHADRVIRLDIGEIAP